MSDAPDGLVGELETLFREAGKRITRPFSIPG
jgi:hypothetical protein